MNIWQFVSNFAINNISVNEQEKVLYGHLQSKLVNMMTFYDIREKTENMKKINLTGL
jgi:hypothetical protein